MRRSKILLKNYFQVILGILLIVTNIPFVTIATEVKAAESDDYPAIYIASDSTAQTYDSYWKPQAGWGQMLDRYFISDVTIHNHAIGGRSTKTFYEEGRLDDILKNIQPDDYLLIQFGHNDATISRPERYVTVEEYKDFLEIYVTEVRDRDAIPILVTPVGRRDFNSENGIFNVSFPEYVKGMEEVAADLDVLLVDLSTLSREYYNEIGSEGSRSVFLHADAGIYEAHQNGVQDDTHFQEYGAIQIARLLSEGIKNLEVELANYVTDIELPEKSPAKPDGVKASSISNAGAKISWDTVEEADIYRIYRKQDGDANYELVSTSTVPQLNLSGLADNSVYQIVVSAMNGKGESEYSDPIEVKTKEATLKFDFGVEGSPVGDGYTEVNLSTLYTEERGYGIVDNEGMIGRDRDHEDPVLSDWLGYFDVGWDFNVDVPNGLYAVKVYVADFLGSARTHLTIGDEDYGAISAPREGWTEKVIPEVEVTNGQLNFHFGGATGIANGLEITPILQAPSNLALDDLSLEMDNTFVAISWEGLEEAVSYNIYRKVAGSNETVLIDNHTETSFIDETVMVGNKYEYTVTTIDHSGTETIQSLPLNISMIDENQKKPQKPKNLRIDKVNQNEISMRWDPSSDAIFYHIYRAELEDGDYVMISQTDETIFMDEVDEINVPYFYKVASVNTGGISEVSEVLVFPVDHLAPTTTAQVNQEPVNGWYNDDVQIYFNAVDDESGVDYTYYIVNEGKQVTGDSLLLNKEGEYVIQYWSVDKVGNIEEVKELNILIDKTSPTVDFSIEDGANFFVNEEIEFACIYSDELSGIESIECEEKSIYAYELGTGKYKLSASATDLAGNHTKKSIEIEVIVDYTSLAELTELLIRENNGDEAIIDLLKSKLANAEAADHAEDFEELNTQLSDYVLKIENSINESLSKEEGQLLISLASTFLKEDYDKNEHEEDDGSIENKKDEKAEGKEGNDLSEQKSLTTNGSKESKNNEQNNVLPKTATFMYNSLLIGIILLLMSGGIWIYSHKKEF